MKLFALWIFSFLYINELQSQNCKSLDKETFFASIKFGAQIPVNLLDCGKKKNVNLSTFTQVQIAYDNLNKECKKKYVDLFNYHKVRFSITQIETNNKGRIMEVSMYSYLDKLVEGSAINYNPPAEFTALYKKLKALYGKPTNIETPTRIDSILIRQKGMTQKVG